MNMSAARVWMQTQARAASAMGMPDCSGWFEAADDRARRVFSEGAEQLVNTAQRASEAATELQREVSRVVDIQTSTLAQTLQYGLQELGSQTSEGLSQLVETAREQAEEAERTASEMGEQMRQGIEEGAEQMRRSRAGGMRALQEIGEAGEQEGEHGEHGEEHAEGGGRRRRRAA
jgi:Fe2+ transport system protein B